MMTFADSMRAAEQATQKALIRAIDQRTFGPVDPTLLKQEEKLTAALKLLVEANRERGWK